MTSAAHARRAYDHRLRDQVRRTGALSPVHHLDIPRSTVATWKTRGARPVVTLEEFGQDRTKLVDRIEKLEQRVTILLGDGRLGDGEAELEQLAMDARRTPERVRRGHLEQ